MCFPDNEFIIGDVDLLLGEIEGAPFYIDYRLYEAWNKAELMLDVAPGEPDGFSLGPGGACTSWSDQKHAPFQTRSPYKRDQLPCSSRRATE